MTRTDIRDPERMNRKVHEGLKLSCFFFLRSPVSCFILKLLPSRVASCFSLPPSSVFPFLPLTCPFPASLHQLYLIPLLVCVYTIFVLPHVSSCQFHPSSPLTPPGVSPPVSRRWYVSVICSMSFHWFVLCFWFAFVFLFFCVCVYISFCFIKLNLRF